MISTWLNVDEHTEVLHWFGLAVNSKLFGQPAGELQAQTFSLVACLVRTFSPKQTERKPIPPGLGMRSELG
jgi:hypothetical protein